MDAVLRDELKLLVSVSRQYFRDLGEHQGIDWLEVMLVASRMRKLKLPFYGAKVAAGFPSSGDSFIEDLIDLNEYLIKNPASTYFMRNAGDALINIGVYSGDLLVVDRAIEPENGKIVVAACDEMLIVRRYYKDNESILLLPENDKYQAIDITNNPYITIWGVVTAIIHKV